MAATPQTCDRNLESLELEVPAPRWLLGAHAVLMVLSISSSLPWEMRFLTHQYSSGSYIVLFVYLLICLFIKGHVLAHFFVMLVGEKIKKKRETIMHGSMHLHVLFLSLSTLS
jgi:hypothetical protein